MAAALNLCWRLLGTALGFVLFGVGGLLLTLFWFPLLALCLRGERRRTLAQLTIRHSFRLFLGVLRGWGVLDYRVSGMPADLRGVGLLLLNRDELAAFAQHTGLPHNDLPTSWHALQQRGLSALLVTQGADGATLCTPGSVQHHPPPERLDSLDVTGAGDALSATTLHALWVQGLPLPESLARGQQAAAAVLLSLESA
jgi:hypothetical protein